MATINAPANPRIVPVLQGSEGTASVVTSSHTIESFKEPVKSYLDKIFVSIDTDSSKTAAAFIAHTQKDTAEKTFADRNGFFQYMSSSASSAMAPLPKQRDLSRPISN